MMSRRVSGILALCVLTCLIVVAAAASAQTIETYRDEFSSISYSGNSGTESFSGSWRERGESDGPNGGVVRVVADSRCSGGTGNCLRIGSEIGDISGFAADRAADIETAESATLSYAWRRRTSGGTDASVRVRASADGGSSWTTVATISLSGSQSPQSVNLDILGFASATTTVRFEGQGTGSGAYLLIDNVSIDATFGVDPTTTSSSTTTTTTPTTTTVPSTTTTLTSPPTSTTTTATPGEDPSSTTTIATPDAPTTTTTGVSSTGREPSGTPPTNANTGTSPGSDGTSHPSATMASGSAEQQTAADTTTPVPSDEQATALAPIEASDNGVARTAATVGLVQLIGLSSLIGLLGAVGVGRRNS